MGRPALRLLASSPAAGQATPESVVDPQSGQPVAAVIPAGRLVELSTPQHGPGAATTTAVGMVIHAQKNGETTVWLQPAAGPLYPPDLADAGVDLDALVVIHVPAASGPHGSCKAAELLLRSGAFGLVVIDLSSGVPPGSGEAWQGRLLGLARQHHARVAILTEKPTTAASLGPLVGIRVEPQRRRVSAEELASIEPGRPGRTCRRSGRGRQPGRFLIEHSVLKNKTGKLIEPAVELHRGPWGL